MTEQLHSLLNTVEEMAAPPSANTEVPGQRAGGSIYVIRITHQWDSFDDNSSSKI